MKEKKELLMYCICGICGTSESGEGGFCIHGHDHWIEPEDLNNPELKDYVEEGLANLGWSLDKLKNAFHLPLDRLSLLGGWSITHQIECDTMKLNLPVAVQVDFGVNTTGESVMVVSNHNWTSLKIFSKLHPEHVLRVDTNNDETGDPEWTRSRTLVVKGKIKSFPAIVGYDQEAMMGWVREQRRISYKVEIVGQQKHITRLNQVWEDRTVEEVNQLVSYYWDADYCDNEMPKWDGNSYELNSDYYIRITVN